MAFTPFNLSLTGDNTGSGNGGGNPPPDVTSSILKDFGAGAASALPGSGAGSASAGYGFLDKFDADGLQTQQGLLSPALSGIGSAFNIYAGLKAIGQQEDALDFQKESFEKNFAANKASFQENLRSKFSRKATLGGNKGVSEQEFVDKRSDF